MHVSATKLLTTQTITYQSSYPSEQQLRAFEKINCNFRISRFRCNDLSSKVFQKSSRATTNGTQIFKGDGCKIVSGRVVLIFLAFALLSHISHGARRVGRQAPIRTRKAVTAGGTDFQGIREAPSGRLPVNNKSWFYRKKERIVNISWKKHKPRTIWNNKQSQIQMVTC